MDGIGFAYSGKKFEMKRITFASLVALALLQSCAGTPLQKDITPKTTAENNVSRTLIVSYDPKVGKKPLMEAIKQMGAQVLYDYSNLNMVAIRLKDGVDRKISQEYLQKVPGVTNVENDSVVKTQ